MDDSIALVREFARWGVRLRTLRPDARRTGAVGDEGTAFESDTQRCCPSPYLLPFHACASCDALCSSALDGKALSFPDSFSSRWCRSCGPRRHLSPRRSRFLRTTQRQSPTARARRSRFWPQRSSATRTSGAVTQRNCTRSTVRESWTAPSARSEWIPWARGSGDARTASG